VIEWLRLATADKFVCTIWTIMALLFSLFIISVLVTAVTTAFYNAKLRTLKKHGCLNTKEENK